MPSGHSSFRSSSSRSRAQDSWFLPEPEASEAWSHHLAVNKHHLIVAMTPTMIQVTTLLITVVLALAAALTVQVVINRRVFDKGHVAQVLCHTPDVRTNCYGTRFSTINVTVLNSCVGYNCCCRHPLNSTVNTFAPAPKAVFADAFTVMTQ